MATELRWLDEEGRICVKPIVRRRPESERPRHANRVCIICAGTQDVVEWQREFAEQPFVCRSCLDDASHLSGISRPSRDWDEYWTTERARELLRAHALMRGFEMWIDGIAYEKRTGKQWTKPWTVAFNKAARDRMSTQAWEGSTCEHS